MAVNFGRICKRDIIFFALGTAVGVAFGYFLGKKGRLQRESKGEEGENEGKLSDICGVDKAEEVEKEERRIVANKADQEQEFTSRNLKLDEHSIIGERFDYRNLKPEEYQRYYDYVKFYDGAQGEVDPADLEAPSEDDDSVDPGMAVVVKDAGDYLELEIKDALEREEMVKSGELETEENRNEFWIDEVNAEMNSGKKPKIITAESFDNDYPHFEKMQLSYYVYDEVLTEEDSDEEILDAWRLIGDCLDKYDFRNSEERVIFVRNFSDGCDFEISKVYASFSETFGQ